MSLKVPKASNLQLFKEGYKHLQGIDEAVLRNIQAVAELSDLVRTSFGPNGSFQLLSCRFEDRCSPTCFTVADDRNV